MKRSEILENYRLDIRDFSQPQLEILKLACSCRTNNRELRSKLRTTIKYQEYVRGKYFKRVSQARQSAYVKHLNSKLRAKLGLPGSLSQWYLSQKERMVSWRETLSSSAMSKYTQNTLIFPEIDVGEDLIGKPHIIAAMPAECANLTGWERVKKAFLPERYVEHFDRENPTHVFNKNLYLKTTFMTGGLIGLAQGFEHAKRALDEYKRKAAGELYESLYWAHRARQSVFIKSFVKYFYRWGWRAGLLYSVFYGVSQSLTIYRMEDHTSHYLLGAGTAAALYYWTKGPVAMLTYGFFGSLFIGLPVGVIFAGLGYNPRPMLYHSNADPKLSSPFHESNWSEGKILMSWKRTVAILELLTEPYSPEINNSQFYQDFLGKV